MGRYLTRLTVEHDRGAFESGEADIDRWFRETAGQAEMRFDSARTWVLVDDDVEDGRRPLGYHALAAHSVEWELLPDRHGKGQPRSGVPAFLLARLGRDLEWRGHGIGEALMRHAVTTALEANRYVAASLLVVDALHDGAAEWYAEFGFVQLQSESERLRLVARLQALAESL